MKNSHLPQQISPLDSVDILNLGKSKFVVISPNRLEFCNNISSQELKQKVELGKQRLLKANNKKIGRYNPLSGIANITILPTFNCNLRCIYCYARGGEKIITADKKTIRKFLDYARNLFRTKELKISFIGGGEPLLIFDLVKDAVDYARSLFSKVYISVVTNGTFNESICEWLIKNKAELRISYDGLFQGIQRPAVNSLDNIKIDKNIEYLVKKKYSFIIQCVITSLSVNSMAENAMFLYKKG